MHYTSGFSHKTYSSYGFVIGRKKFGEADRIVVLFTKDFGKISVIAKGVRKVTSRKRGGIEIFSYIKFSAAKGKSLDILTEVQVIDAFDGIRDDLKKVSLGYYFCEVLGKLTRDGEKHEELFEIFRQALETLKTKKQSKEMRLTFVKDTLVAIGFWPEGSKMDNPDAVLENITERKINSFRVGRKMLQQS